MLPEPPGERPLGERPPTLGGAVVPGSLSALSQDPQSPDLAGLSGGDDGQRRAVEVTGAVRELSPRGLGRALGLLSLWLPLRSACSLFAHGLLGYRRSGTLSISAGQLHLRETRRLFGRQLRLREVVLVPAQLSAIEVFRGIPGRTVGAALFALALGTSVGTGLLAAGLSAPGMAPSLLGLGIVFVMAGVLVDYVWLGQTAVTSKRHDATLFRVELASGRGFELIDVDPTAAEALLRFVRAQLG